MTLETVAPTRPTLPHAQPKDVRSCSACDRGAASHPVLAGPPSLCKECWSSRVEAYREAHPPLKIRTLHRNSLAAEYELREEDQAVGRIILLRDSMTVCVRFFSFIRGDSELVLEEALKGLLGTTSRGYLNVIIFSAPAGERSADEA